MKNAYGINEQALEALELANRIRIGRAQIRREIKDGTVSVQDVLETMPYVVKSMTVLELLCCQFRFNTKRSAKVLRRANIGENRQLGDLTERQKKNIVLELEYGYKTYRYQSIGS